MKSRLPIAGAIVVTAGTLLWSSAGAVDHKKYDHTEGETCTCLTPPQCYDQKNKLWLCKPADKGSGCVWRQNKACLNKVKDKEYKEGDDVTGKFPQGQ